ncbi:MAG: VWA domain-containing protein [bacterium]|nr:VWA domain-containing protein [bacterium]
MRFFSTLLVLIVISLSTAFANGVAIVNARTGVYLPLDSTTVQVVTESQIAITTTTQSFVNHGNPTLVKYGFPLPDQASAIQLRWHINGEWHTAAIAGVQQDTTLPGGNANTNLLAYLGQSPLFFSIPQMVLTDSLLIVELTYVDLLPYSFGNVSYVYPSDYHLIQPVFLGTQRFEFRLSSPRTIDSIRVLSSHPITQIANYGDSALVRITFSEMSVNANISLQYSLNAQQLGLYAYSNLFPQEILPDSLGRGFLTFIAEPAPDTTLNTIAKVFTLIVDRSGSMSGTKIIQARNAATFIVQNLNEGDRFNIIDFDGIITSFRPGHVPYTTENRDAALAYINTLTARSMTNISGAFSIAVPQFAAASDSTANIIIFFTDGQATEGITSTPALVSHVDGLIAATETRINLFCFGIGSDANQQLLTLLSSHNSGIAEFLGNDELYSRITSFYLTIRNPVLLNSQIAFVPPVISEVYPATLPNLYKGKQMIVVGRYQEAAPVQITLSGNAFGRPVSYTYNVALIDSNNIRYHFLTKIWAKQKIEWLLVRYYSLNANSPEAQALRAQIIQISLAYGVISPFTSFSGGGGGGGTEVDEPGSRESALSPATFRLIGNYPNPFNATTTIRLHVNVDYRGTLAIRIYNTLGQVVRVLHLTLNGQGEYQVIWDGLADSGKSLSNGVYFYAIELNNTIMVEKMQLLK